MANFDNMFLTDEDKKKLEQQASEAASAQAAQQGNPLDTSVPVSIPGAMASAPQTPQKDIQVEEDEPIVTPVQKLKQLLATSKPPASPESVPVSDAISKLLSGDSEALSSAQEQRNQNQLMAILGKAGTQIGSAIARAPADTSTFDALLKMANQPVEDFETKQSSTMKTLKNASAKEMLKNEMAKEDPYSDISKIGRQILLAAGSQAGHQFKVPENLSLSNMEKLLPGIENMANRRLAAQSLAQRTQDSRDDKQAMLDQRIESQTNNQVKSETGDYVRNLDQANRTQDIFKDIKAGKYKSSSNIASALQSDISALLTGAKQTAVYDRSHAEIKAMEKTWNEVLSYAQSHPRDTIPASYMKQLEDEVETLKGAVIKNYSRKNKELMSGTNNKVKKDLINNRFSTQLNELGYDPETLKPKSQQFDMSGEDKEAIEWAKANKSDPRAQQILKMHGME